MKNGERAAPAPASMDEVPVLSIVIPAFMADLELRRCVDSVRIACPDRARCEVIVVLPAGRVPDAQRWLPDEHVLAERHPSIYGAMNDGAAASRGRYLYFLGKDDIVLPGFAQVVAELESSTPRALFFDVYWGGRGVYSGRPSRLRLLTRNLCHQGIVYARDTFNEHGPYLRRMTVQADHLLNIRVLWDAASSGRIAYLPLALTWYSGAGFSAQRASDPLFWRLYPATLRKHVGGWAAGVLWAWRKLRGVPRR
jgi:hypothetical protein